MPYYLQLDGIDDKFVTPSITYNEIIIDFMRLSSSSGALQYLLDARQSNSTYAYLYSSGDAGPESFGGVTNVYKNGVSVTSGTEFMSHGERMTLRLLTTTQTSIVYFFARNTSIQFAKSNVYSIKFYNAGVLVAHYDMTLGNVQDQSGNGRHATLTGGTWVQDEPAYTEISTTLSLANVVYKDSQSILNLVQSVFKDNSNILDLKQVIYKDSTGSLNLVQAIYKDIQSNLDLINQMYKDSTVNLDLILSIRDDIYIYKQILETVFNISMNIDTEFNINKDLYTTTLINREIKTTFNI